MRISGALIIIICSTYYGFFMGFRIKSRRKRLSEFEESFKYICETIRCTRTQMPEIFMQLADRTKLGYIHDFYQYLNETIGKRDGHTFDQMWRYAVMTYAQDIYLTDYDCEVLCKCGDIPLNLDRDTQIATFEHSMMQLDKIIDEIDRTIIQKSRIYSCTGFTVGIFIVLALI